MAKSPDKIAKSEHVNVRLERHLREQIEDITKRERRETNSATIRTLIGEALDFRKGKRAKAVSQ